MKSDIKLTPSRVRDFLSCPLKFGRLYGPAEEYPSLNADSMEGLAADPMGGAATNASQALNAAMSLSNSLHSALEALHHPSQTELLGLNTAYADPASGNGQNSSSTFFSSLSDEQLSSVISQHWQSDGYDDSQREEAAYRQACDILRYYARSKHTPTGQVLATEAYLTALTTLSGYRVELSCRADRIELHDNGILEVLDYKLIRNGELPSAHVLAEDLSSFLYFLLIGHHYKRNPDVHAVRISQLNLMTLTKVEIGYDRHQIERHKEALTELVATVMRGSLEPRINASCAWCPVQGRCPAWSVLDIDSLTKLATRPEKGDPDE